MRCPSVFDTVEFATASTLQLPTCLQVARRACPWWGWGLGEGANQPKQDEVCKPLCANYVPMCMCKADQPLHSMSEELLGSRHTWRWEGPTLDQLRFCFGFAWQGKQAHWPTGMSGRSTMAQGKHAPLTPYTPLTQRASLILSPQYFWGSGKLCSLTSCDGAHTLPRPLTDPRLPYPLSRTAISPVRLGELGV